MGASFIFLLIAIIGFGIIYFLTLRKPVTVNNGNAAANDKFSPLIKEYQACLFNAFIKGTNGKSKKNKCNRLKISHNAKLKRR